MSWPALLLALLAALVGYVLLTVKVNTRPSDFSRLDVAGPVIAGCSTGINLDGLSLSRTVRLPTVTIKLPGLGSLKIKAISSELVFPQLRLADVRVTASDAIKQGIAVSAIVDTSLTGSCAVKTDLTLAIPGFGSRLLTSNTSGRITVSLTGLKSDVALLPGHDHAGHPKLHIEKLHFPEGKIRHIEFSASSLAGLGKYLPLSWSLQPVAAFLVRDAMRSREVRQGSAYVWDSAKPHLDVKSWSELKDHQRELDQPKLLDSLTALQAHFSLNGRTSFVDIPLPDQAPNLYPEGGKRAYLQSWNKFTSEMKLEITKNAIRQITFSRAVLEWNILPHVPPQAAEAITQESNVMLCRLQDFTVEVGSHFALYANTGKAIKLVTGMETFGERGGSRATVKAAKLELVFRVSIDNEGVKVVTQTVGDFDSVNVAIEGLKGKKGEVVNQVLKFVSPHIATVVSALVKRFLEAEVKKGTKLFETVEEAMLMRGVEVPGLFRAHKRTEDVEPVEPTAAEQTL